MFAIVKNLKANWITASSFRERTLTSVRKGKF